MLQNFIQPKRHTIGPKIFFSYGMTKCGTTLGFELLRTGLEFCGYPQPVLPLECGIRNKKLNYIIHVTTEEMENLWAKVEHLGYPIIVKTHTRPDPAIIKLLEDGRAEGHAILRDPRDMALSMLDHGERARFNQQKAFSEIHNIEDALIGIRDQTQTLQRWLELPGISPLNFDALAFNINACCAQMLSDIGLDYAPVGAITHHVLKNRFIQFNKGIRHRHRQEMPSATSEVIYQEFSSIYRILEATTPALPANMSA